MMIVREKKKLVSFKHKSRLVPGSREPLRRATPAYGRLRIVMLLPDSLSIVSCSLFYVAKIDWPSLMAKKEQIEFN
jgi:hypothetical protein